MNENPVPDGSPGQFYQTLKERISKLENRSIKIIQSEEQKEKR